MQFPRYDHPYPYTPEGRERQRQLLERATEVFGDADLSWLHRQQEAVLGMDRLGYPYTPDGYVAVSDENLAQILAQLDELAKTVTPRWDESPSAVRRRKRQAKK